MKFPTRIILFVFLLITVTCSKIENSNISELDFIPLESVKIININDLSVTKNILENNQLISNLYPNSKIVYNNLNLLSNSFTKKGVLSLSPFSKGETAYTFISRVELSDSIFNNDDFNRNYQNFDIYSKKNINKTIYMTIIGDFYISSDNDIVLENIIRDHKTNNKKINPDLLKISKTIDRDDPFNFFIKSDGSNSVDYRSYNLPLLPKVKTSWIGYDFTNSTDIVELSGVTKLGDSLNSKISILKSISSKGIISDNVIPNTFRSLFSFNVGDSERFIFNLKNYFKSNNIAADDYSFKSINLINDISIVDDQEKFLVISLKNTDQIIEYFNFQESNYTDINFINLDEGLKLLLQTFSYDPKISYSTLINNFLIIGKSVSQLRNIINSNKINDVLGFNSVYTNYKKNISSNNNFIWVVNTKNKMNSSIMNSLDSDSYPFISFGGKFSQDIALLNFDFKKINTFSQEGEAYTEFLISSDSEIISDPIWIKNHTTNEYDFVFQDIENVLHYYSNKGNLIWRRNLSSRIIGDVKQIDIYKNGRLQMLFRTEDKLYLIDRNGNQVNDLSFDLELADNINPISVFDYEKNRNYRVVVSYDNQIKMFDAKGEIVNGFSPDNFSSDIIKSPVHIRIDGKDYIVIQLENGDLKILNRRGEDRIVVENKIQYNDNTVYSYLGSFTTSDNQGNLIQIDTNGNFNRNNLNLSENSLINISDDKLIYISEDILSIKGINVKLPIGRYSKPKIFNISGNFFIGTTDLNDNNIYLYNDSGELVKGFPLKGSSSYDLIDSDMDGKLEIISKIDNFSIVSYEIN